MKIVFLDKDGTLGNFRPGSKGLFPKTVEFLRRQKRKERKLFAVTDANATGAAHLAGLPLDGYFGREKAASSKKEMYITPDGKIRNIHDDYLMRKALETEEEEKRLDQEALEHRDRMFAIRRDTAEKRRLQEEINRFFDYWGELLHKETKEPFDEATQYRNPNGGWFPKDLYLVKRRISPQGYDKINAVMVGDGADTGTVISDPETPLIVISGRVASGEWHLVESALDLLFSDDGSQTWENFEALFSYSRPGGEEAKFVLSLNGVEYAIEKGKYGERIIHCPIYKE
jgi:hypothetical protein